MRINNYEKKPLCIYTCKINFTNKVLHFINVARIQYSEEIIDSHPNFIEQDNIPMVIYAYSVYKVGPYRLSYIFDYHAFVNDLIITSFMENPNTVTCPCNNFDLEYIDKNHQSTS